MTDKLLLDLLDDMLAYPSKYSMSLMRQCLGYQEVVDGTYDKDSPAGRFLDAGLKLDPAVLVQEGIVPDMTYRFSYRPRYNMERVDSSPVWNREVLFIGLSGSGKTSVLAGLVDYMYNSGKAIFYCSASNRSAENCLELVHCIRDHCFPVRTELPFVRCNILDAGKSRGWSFIDIRGREMSQLGEFQSSRCGLSSIDASLVTDNKKTLLFVIDTEAWLSEEKGIVDHQVIFLSKVLSVMLNDGPDRSRPSRGCTISKTKTIAIILTKADMWRDSIPSSPLLEDHLRSLFIDKMTPFYSELHRINKKYGINKNMDNGLCIMTYSAGKRLVGNLLKADPRDAQRLAHFLMNDTFQR